MSDLLRTHQCPSSHQAFGGHGEGALCTAQWLGLQSGCCPETWEEEIAYPKGT